MNRLVLTISMIALCAICALAQPAERLYHLSVYPVSGKWNYPAGEKVKIQCCPHPLQRTGRGYGTVI